MRQLRDGVFQFVDRNSFPELQNHKEASRAGLTFIKGEKDIVVQNEKGVVINVKATAKGMNLGLVEGGLTIEEVK